MPKVGNYVQRDYNTRSNRKSTWSDYNKAWASKRSNAINKSQQLRNIANSFAVISTQASRSATSLVLQNQNSGSPYASNTAVMSRINVLV
ncbi:flagellar biosynthesis protein [Roseibium sp.]|uniref:flagellar biosynthesis protein n=1 Tax=Roseibium sp. TaxID=1936156 RepID=UPI003A974737